MVESNGGITGRWSRRREVSLSRVAYRARSLKEDAGGDESEEVTVDEVLRLEEPTASLAESYQGLVREFLEGGEHLVPFPLSFPHDDFAAFLDRLTACARGEGLPPGFVAHSTYWLVRGGTEVVGVSNLRHQLTEALRREGGHIGYGVRPSARRSGIATELLRQTLVRAGAMGLSEVLITCDRANEPSIRTILRNGGVLASEEFLPERGESMQRYRITIRPQT